ncbi:MAG: Ppx/GppA family phosphatase [Nitrospirae bacterium]|nr:Ppx/GppA family phosphatase [Nitrospirota bacterium]
MVKNRPLAAIDIGTNTTRLLIGRVKRNGIERIYSERIVTRLGEGITGRGLITKRAIKRGIEALRQFSDVISLHDVLKTSVAATSALRDAKNRDEFLKQAKDAAGFDIEVISGEKEARITSAGMLSGITQPVSALMADIGGGSTELIFARRKKPELVHSLNLGVVYLADKYMKHDPLLKTDLKRMDNEISRRIMPAAGVFKKLFSGDTVFIGTAGTVTALSAIAQRLKRFDHCRIHNSRMTFKKTKNIFLKISSITAAERVEYHPFDPSRLDIIVPGTLILLKLMETFGFNEIIVSDHGLKEGILLELYSKIGT